jgi:hypothetical protein
MNSAGRATAGCGCAQVECDAARTARWLARTVDFIFAALEVQRASELVLFENFRKSARLGNLVSILRMPS